MIDSGVRDEIEHYSSMPIPLIRSRPLLTHSPVHRNVAAQEHPTVLRPFVPELAAFARQNHYQVLHPILRLVAIGCDYFVY